MGFVGVYRAIFDYTPQADQELAITEGDLLFVLDKSSDDDWWKAKKKASADEEDEPVGLIPNNYIEEAKPITQVRALYEYTRQTEEELSFPEDATLEVFDTSDPDWILVGLDAEYGFVPSNYIDMPDDTRDASQASPAPPALPTRPPAEPAAEAPPPIAEDAPPVSAVAAGPAAALAAAMQGRAVPRPPTVSFADEPTSPPLPQRTPVSPVRLEPEEEPTSPPLPSRPVPPLEHRDAPARSKSPPMPLRPTRDVYEINPSPLSPGGFRMYNINEMVSVMGKKKKMPTTLGVNLATGIIMIAPEKAQDGPTQEWTGDKMTHYSREGKHVFLELVQPSKSIDFHAGAKDTAEEIVGALGELAGAIKGVGLREVIAAGKSKGQKKGKVLYDFTAQGDDEVSVKVDDDVIVLDDRLSEEWWKVRVMRHGREGVVPSSYVEVTATLLSPTSVGTNAGRSTVEQNRLDEIRLTKAAVKKSAEVGDRAALPERGSSLSRAVVNEAGQRGTSQENGHSRSSKSKPDPAKVRTWTDRSKSFSVDAQFLGLKDGKINLHKMNGVKIAVPVNKMSVEDLDYVERFTGASLPDRPSSDKRIKSPTESRSKIGASVESRKPGYDWFQFFLSCDVAVGLCDRYAQAFVKDSMDESVLPDVDAGILRNLGLREGDIIKVMRFLDAKHGRSKNKRDGEGEGGGLFSGPGGTLRNNTRKGRPSPATQTSDTVDATAFGGEGSGSKSPKGGEPASLPIAGTKKGGGAFDDDAWDVKPAKTAPAKPASALKPSSPEEKPADATSKPTPPSTQQLSGSMQELSLLSAPLEPTKAPLAAPTAQPDVTPEVSVPNTQPVGAAPSLFNAVASTLASTPATAARQRPAAPTGVGGQGSLLPPPPPRPLSAPQTSSFGPPVMPQMTGMQTQVAPAGQSLNDLTQSRMQQQYMQQQQQQQQQQMPTGQYGIMPQPTGMMSVGPQVGGYVPGFGGQPNMMPQMTGIQPQQTGFPGQYGQTAQTFVSGPVNNYLPAPLEPQRTAVNQPLSPGLGATLGPFGGGQQQQAPLAPLTAQRTGPPPPIRFGVQPEAKTLAPQVTGRRANLSQATPENPFGF